MIERYLSIIMQLSDMEIVGLMLLIGVIAFVLFVMGHRTGYRLGKEIWRNNPNENELHQERKRL